MKFRSLAAFASILAIVGVAAGPAAWAGHITLNDTGVTQCADGQGVWSSECAQSRQDAAYGRDVNYANPDDGVAGFSFVKVCRSGQTAGEGTCPDEPVIGDGSDDWGCTLDIVSQLIWEAKTANGGVHDGVRQYQNRGSNAGDHHKDVASLIDTTNEEALCGATNWRLPEVLELQSIVNYGVGAPGGSGPFVDQAFFPNIMAWQTWSGTKYAVGARYFWSIHLGVGHVELLDRRQEAPALLVHDSKLANGQAALAKARFVPSADGTEVTDAMTGLVWSRCAAGMVWNNDAQTCDGAATRFYWKDALSYAKRNRAGGWRLPNIKELFSIVDHKKTEPAIDSIAFPNTSWRLHLSSTPNGQDSLNSVKAIEFTAGGVYSLCVAPGDKCLLRMVRRGRE
jgi:hypothetical protein